MNDPNAALSVLPRAFSGDESFASVPSAAVYPRPDPSGLTGLQRDLLQKMDLEAAMLASPQDGGLRALYFDLLTHFAGTRTGLATAHLPELGHPLYFRCGSTDIANLTQIFRDGGYAFEMAATPRRILDLGAYAGYAAVYLAARFPQAEILSVEPCPNSFRILALNTMPYRRIRSVNAAVWNSTTRLGIGARYYGDWGTQFGDDIPLDHRTTQAYAIPDLLARIGWDQVDFIKCDIEGAEKSVFSDPAARWLRMMDVLAIETHDSMIPGCSETVAACFETEIFTAATHGEAAIYQRRVPLRAIRTHTPRAMPLINCEPGLFPIALQEVTPSPWGFFVFDGQSCQLHPNAPGSPPARALFPRTLDGQTRFAARLVHAGYPSAAITFTVIFQREDGSEVLRSQHSLTAQQEADFEVALPALTGRHRIVLQTEMHPSAPHNYNGWARWIDPSVM